MANQRSPQERIVDAVMSWPGVSVGTGGLGELAVRLGPREIGHLHGDAAAHFGFPRHVWIELRKQGRIELHPMFPGFVGPAARRMLNDGDVGDVIELLRLNYERMSSFRRRE